MFLEYFWQWYSVFIHSWLDYALFLDHGFHSFLATFSIIFALHFASFLDYILRYFWTTFCIGVEFSSNLDFVFHYFWTTFCIIFGVHFPLVLLFHSFLTIFCISFEPPCPLYFDYILNYFFTIFSIIFHFWLHLHYV